MFDGISSYLRHHRFLKEKPIENNFLDVRLDERVLRQLEFNEEQKTSVGNIVSFKGYKLNVVDGKISVNPFIIYQNSEQFSKLEQGVIDGKLWSVNNDWTSNIYGGLEKNMLVFEECGSEVPIRAFSSNDSGLIINQLNLNVEKTGVKPRYELIQNDGVFKGTYYSPPRPNNIMGRSGFYPSYVAQVTMKQVINKLLNH